MTETLKKSFNIIGSSVPRVDGTEKVTGAAKYSCDINFPNMLYGKMLRSTCAHAVIRSIDISKAQCLPGVKAVICHENVPHIPFTTCGTPVDTAPLDTYIFDHKVRYYGEPVAAVAAVSEDIAEKAISLIKIEYDELPAVFDPREAIKPGAPIIQDSFPNNVTGVFSVDIGNVNEGFKQSAQVFEDDYFVPIIQHCTMETHGCVVKPEPNNRLTVWSSTQVPYPLQRILALSIGVPEENITVIMPSVGGGFGSKQEIVAEPICALLALRSYCPVRLIFNREEDIISSRTRHSIYAHIKTGVNLDGTIVAREATLYVNNGAYCSHGLAIPYIAGTCWSHVYNVPHIRFTGNLIYTNALVGGAYRGFGDPQMFFINENHFDRIAKNLGIDPIEFRLKNTIKSGDEDRVTHWDLTKIGLDDCIKQGAEAFGWYQNAKQKQEHAHVLRGIGMASFAYCSSSIPPGAPDSTAATIKLNSDGSVTLMTASVDIGQGSSTIFAQIAAEELGLRYEDVKIAETNTDFTPYDVGTYGTRQVYIGGRAIQGAAQDAKRQIDPIAAQLLGGPEDKLIYEQGKIWLADHPERVITMADVSHEVYFGGVPKQVLGKFMWNSAGIGPAYGAHFAEVEVDRDTGSVKVLRAVAVHDAGLVINPVTAQGQVEGGFVQGLSTALFEEIKLDPASGCVCNPKLNDYKLATAADMPDIQVLFVETPAPNGPYGARGIGEPSFIPAAAAVANAVCNAIDTPIYSLPYTPEKILQAIKIKHSSVKEAGKND